MIENQLIFLSVLAVSLSETNKIAIFYGNATNDLFIRSPNMVKYTLRSNTMLGAIETSDLNDDGLIDLAVCNQARRGTYRHAPLGIFLNTGDDRQFEMNRLSEAADCYILIAIGDFDNDGKQNDISVYHDPDGLQILQSIDYNNDDLITSAYSLHGQALSLTKGRFNDDELDDLALIFPQTDTIQILLAYEDGKFTQEIYPTANHPTSVTRINFNNDQIDDLAVLSCNRTVTVFLGTPSGFLDRNYLIFEPNERSSDQCAYLLKVADLNQDGRDDLVFIDAETHSIGVLLGTSCYEET
jgi:hypothetical protein